MGKGEGLSIGKVHELLGERTGRVLGVISELLRKRAGKALGVMAGIALAASGCAAPTPCNAEQQEQENPAADTQTDSEGNPDLNWKLVDDDHHMHGHPEEAGGEGRLSVACIGSTMVLKISNEDNSPVAITAIPNSPECGGTPSASENSPAPTAETTPTPANGN